jgi:hypothetical protein
MRSLLIFTQYCAGDQIDKSEMGGHVARMGRREVYTVFWWENLRERDHMEDPGIDGRITLRWIFRIWYVGAWVGTMWLRIGTSGGHLRKR